MFKTFTLDRIVDEQLTETEGKRVFHLTDENGDSRTVWGTTLLNEDKVPVSIAANKKREHPLIECLFNSELKDVISIEFKQYNSIFVRDNKEVEVTAQTIDELAKEMQSKPLRVGSLIKSTESIKSVSEKDT